MLLFPWYEHLVLLDIDKEILPAEHSNWADMMEEVVSSQSICESKDETKVRWNFRNALFIDELLDTHVSKHFPEMLKMFKEAR